MEKSADSPGLYARLLGDSWAELAPSVRGMHADGSAVRGDGHLHVTRGSHRLARGLATLMGLPAASEAAPVTLLITPSSDGETWQRTFAGKPLVTRQWLRSDGLLAEQAGRTELRFRLEVRDGGLVYHPVGAALRLGWLRVPLPPWLAPTVAAREVAAGPPGRTEISVRVSVPVLGLLIAYEGLMTPSKEQA